MDELDLFLTAIDKNAAIFQVKNEKTKTMYLHFQYLVAQQKKNISTLMRQFLYKLFFVECMELQSKKWYPNENPYFAETMANVFASKFVFEKELSSQLKQKACNDVTLFLKKLSQNGKIEDAIPKVI